MSPTTDRPHGSRRTKARIEPTGNAPKPAKIELVPGGRRAYLWIGAEAGPCYGTVSGPKTLRRLAEAILREVPDVK